MSTACYFTRCSVFPAPACSYFFRALARYGFEPLTDYSTGRHPHPTFSTSARQQTNSRHAAILHAFAGSNTVDSHIVSALASIPSQLASRPLPSFAAATSYRLAAAHDPQYILAAWLETNARRSDHKWQSVVFSLGASSYEHLSHISSMVHLNGSSAHSPTARKTTSRTCSSARTGASSTIESTFLVSLWPLCGCAFLPGLHKALSSFQDVRLTTWEWWICSWGFSRGGLYPYEVIPYRRRLFVASSWGYGNIYFVRTVVWRFNLFCFVIRSFCLVRD